MTRPGGGRRRPSATRIYYRDGQICVDSSTVSVRGRPYPLRDVEAAWRVRYRAAGPKATNAAFLLTAAVLAQLAIGLLGWSAVAAGGTVVTTAAVLLVRGVVGLMVGVTALRALDDIRRFGRRRELWARIAGTPVLLVGTDDAIRWGQVCRALTRALENRDRR